MHGFTGAGGKETAIALAPQHDVGAGEQACIAVAACVATSARAEQIDTTFNGNGRYIYGQTGTLAFRAVAALPLPDGKVVSVFQFPTFATHCTASRCIALARFKADGTLEQVATFDNDIEEVVAAAVDGNGRIVVVARTNSGPNGRDIHVARYQSDSLSRDLTFAGTGWVRASFNLRDEYPTSVAIDAQNRIVVAGSVSFSATDTDFGFLRLRNDGVPDTSFNASGWRPVSFDLSSNMRLDQANAVAIAGNGDIVAVGTALDASASLVRVAVTRLKSDGSYQGNFCPSGCSFNAGYSTLLAGRTIYRFGSNDTHADEGLSIDTIAAGGYVIAGATYADNGGNRRGALARFTEVGGYVAETIGASLGDNGIYHSVKVADATATRILVAGNSGPSDNFLLLQAFNGNLTPIANYGDCHPQNNGFCPIFGTGLGDHGPDLGRSVAIDALGRPLLQAQGVAVSGGLPALMVARYTNANGPTALFGNGFEGN